LSAELLSGLGKLDPAEDHAEYDKKYVHTDVLVVGGGPAGLAAAREAVRSGARVILIDDVASAIVAGAVSPTVQGEPMDIGSGEFQTIGTAAKLIAQHYNAPAPHVTGQYRQGDVRHAWADITAAKDVLGWTPQYNLAQGIDRLATWIDAQPDVQPA
ncbi:NAD-dependent epimerase/dehydratase family protein, partial [Streptomyces violaceolatus]|uniref:NAD-dependent epimerase/dehydratase family protein n=1 Tax=Streptomyces violaceolatus TaxID=67378 RepID=UPI0031DF4DF4